MSFMSRFTIDSYALAPDSSPLSAISSLYFNRLPSMLPQLNISNLKLQFHGAVVIATCE